MRLISGCPFGHTIWMFNGVHDRLQSLACIVLFSFDFWDWYNCRHVSVVWCTIGLGEVIVSWLIFHVWIYTHTWIAWVIAIFYLDRLMTPVTLVDGAACWTGFINSMNYLSFTKICLAARTCVYLFLFR